MNQHQKYSCKRYLLNKCFNAFIQFRPDIVITKKEFLEKVNQGGYINFIFPDFSRIEVLKRKSDVTFDGVEFKMADQEYHTEYTETQLDLLAAGNSSSVASISSNSRKR
ncbi:hypothetical protein BpHYR1_026688 [Brachionus plicatilis]|uniref:Uncharacterized protein n=1 Tax=Brachionus plicatilis TaxID=10195 RepID=A0A3M7RUP6_BRAPC|nr:hypothetical protein BpHYR1_026688 [Brachionus plicatilis]